MNFPQAFNLPEIDSYLKLDLQQFQIIGRGIAGVESVYTLPQFNVTFDTGRAPSFAFHQDFLALTHWHLDHCGGLPFYIGLRGLNDLPPLKLVVPKAKVDEAKSFVQNLKNITQQQFEVDVLCADQPIVLKPNITLEAVESFHCVPSCGYLVKEKKKKLKNEFAGKSSTEIVDLKKRGIAIEDEHIETLFAYSGDSKVEFFKTEAQNAKVILMECSFFDDTSDMNKVLHYGHSHIKHWVEILEHIKNPTVIMTHTSQRYTRKEVVDACNKHFPKEFLEKLVVFR